jgi:2-hydroxy-6-oxonona-2,4-dienedioate hydrolase
MMPAGEGPAMHRRTLMLGAAMAATAAAALPAGLAYRAAMDEARQAIASGSLTHPTRHGTMEYAVAGDGPPLLMLHVPVIGGSAGALSAIEFAIRHPDRCSALVPLVPASHAPGRAPMRPGALGAAIMRVGLSSDLMFWAGTVLAEDTMIATLLATDPALVHAAAPDEQARVRLILRSILPISARARGLAMDAAQAGDPAPQALDRISAPTLVISLEDDRFLTLDAARHIAATVAGAHLVSYPTGGHVWVGHDADIAERIDRFLRAATARG